MRAIALFALLAAVALAADAHRIPAYLSTNRYDSDRYEIVSHNLTTKWVIQEGPPLATLGNCSNSATSAVNVYISETTDRISNVKTATFVVSSPEPFVTAPLAGLNCNRMILANKVATPATHTWAGVGTIAVVAVNASNPAQEITTSDATRTLLRGFAELEADGTLSVRFQAGMDDSAGVAYRISAVTFQRISFPFA